MEKKYVMAIDQGTTGTRVILFNHQGEEIDSTYREIKQIYPRPGWVEHDPNEYFESVKICAGEVFKNTKINAEEIACIGITNQRETTILWDSETGRPVYNAIVWQCRRTTDMCTELKKKGVEKMVREKTGLYLDPYFSATKIKWILDNVEEAGIALSKGTLRMGTIDSWLTWKLSGGEYHVTEYSNASRTMLLNINTLEWDEDLMDAIGVPEQILPELKPSSGIMAVTDKHGFLGAEIPISGGAGDQQSALFGQACFEPGMAKNTYGTAIGVLMNTGKSPKPSSNGLMSDLVWHAGEFPEYALEGIIFIGGATIQWLRDGLQIIDTAADSSKLAETVPDSGEIYFVPAFAGLGAPHWDPYARGMMIGLTGGTTKAHIARATLESMAYQVKDIINAMIADSGQEAKSLRVDGGASASDLLLQFQADILGVPVERPVYKEMTAQGAAYLAGLGVGFWKDKKELSSHWKLDRTFEPNMSVDQRENIYKGWQAAVKRSYGWLKDLT